MRVANASPLIHLARVSLLDVLREPRGSVEVLVPEVVLHEVLIGASRGPSARSMEYATEDWLRIVPTPQPHFDINLTRIDAGEIAVLSVALYTPGATVVLVLDDLLARTEAARLGIPVTGTLRLLLDAKKLGIIPSMRDPLQRLRDEGMRLPVSLKRIGNWGPADFSPQSAQRTRRDY
jgi:predicted nucleic acid-binding protein